jgi:hypothetical protein
MQLKFLEQYDRFFISFKYSTFDTFKGRRWGMRDFWMRGNKVAVLFLLRAAIGLAASMPLTSAKGFTGEVEQ